MMNSEELVLEGSPFSNYLDSISMNHKKVKIDDHQLYNLINDNAKSSDILKNNDLVNDNKDKIKSSIHQYSIVYKDILEKSSLFVDDSPFYRNEAYVEYSKLNLMPLSCPVKPNHFSHIFIVLFIFAQLIVYLTVSNLIILSIFIALSMVAIFIFKPFTYFKSIMLQSQHNKNIRNIEQYISSCKKYKSIVKKGINIIQEIELVSRGYKLSSYLSPIARLEKNAKMKKSNVLREVISESLCSIVSYHRNTHFLYTKSNNLSADFIQRDSSLISIKKYEKIVNKEFSDILTELLLALGFNNDNRIQDKHILSTFKSINTKMKNLSDFIEQEFNKIFFSIDNDNWIGKVDANEAIKKFKRVDDCVTFDEELSKLHNEIKTINALITLCKEDFVIMASSKEDSIVEEQLNRLYSQFYKVKDNLTHSLELWESAGKSLYKLHQTLSSEEQSKKEINNTNKTEELVSNNEEESVKENEESNNNNNTPSNVLIIHEAESLLEDSKPIMKTKISREERIKQMKEKREKEKQVKTSVEDRLSMIKELKDVLSHMNNENTEAVTIKHNFM